MKGLTPSRFDAVKGALATIARWWTIFLNELSLLSTALAAVATWRRNAVSSTYSKEQKI
jgi:hypothetical protein